MLYRYRGCLLGLATGDALGTTLEFRPPGSFTPIDDKELIESTSGKLFTLAMKK
jgi:ADP-ribosylglycohydrolase